MLIEYIKGDVLESKVDGLKLILNIVNNKCTWGKGFVLSISKKWDKPEKAYREWQKLYPCLFKLGQVQYVKVEDDIVVINAIAQDGFCFVDGKPPAKMDALASCIKSVINSSMYKHYSVIMPRICCGLGGETWDHVEPVVNEFIKHGIPVYVYDL